ncbi:tetratricopeptide repeat protein [Alteromonas sp. ASW11-19]|uniref:Tetratricopeptide repeat protein n=1 Tax=Alteromonas salexigens TaxID=2982530 RepID=A0ABT2VRV7_9ALTE|nr:tetratricopeptide repeat protein [Alteromonas salexigens]MCU7556057.1 tetratricopeptide repeat protein [Alteromonas salexigens]
MPLRTSRRTLLSAISAALLLAGCTTNSEQAPVVATQTDTPLLNSLDIKPVTVTPSEAPVAPLTELRDGYGVILKKLKDPELAQHIQLRLGDVEMLLAEKHQADGTQDPRRQTNSKAWQRAIDTYEALLDTYPDEETQEEILYQLSRAYDLQGQTANSVRVLRKLLEVQPDSLHAPEAWFRLGEAHYANDRYQDAARAYRLSMQADASSNFYVMSAYMKGWSHFKLEQYDGALSAFDTMVDASFSALPEAVFAFNGTPPEVDMLPKGEQKLVSDALRIMALLFSYRGDGEAIAAFYAERDVAPHQYLIYQELAQQHLNNDRYQDAADVYLEFALRHVSHPLSVAFFVKHVDAFILGDFPSLALQAKARFVNTFGATYGVWNEWSEIYREKSAPYLHDYLLTLSQTEHSLAQSLAENPADPNLTERQAALVAALNDKQLAKAYANAARYYREFITLFPDDPKTPDMQFYLAESLYDAGKFEEAIAAYEKFAYQNLQHEQAAQGAYNALLAYEQLTATKPAQTDAQNASRERFVNTFTQDARAPRVAQTLMQHFFDRQQYPQAQQWSEWLLAFEGQGDAKLTQQELTAARVVKAYSLYGQQAYTKAQPVVETLLASLPESDPRYPELAQTYATILYRQADAAVAQNKLPEAIEHLTTLIEALPASDARINAQYDVISHLLSLKDYQAAERYLNDFARRFPEHELQQTVPDKLLFVYEQTEQWGQAAAHLMERYQADPNTAQGRDALWQAADYYMEAEQREQALAAYRTYAHNVPRPFDRAVEARYTMSEFYKQSGEDSKRRYWLNKLITHHDEAGDDATPRSRTLAAMSAMVFATDAETVFERIKLTAPIRESLAQKRQALEKALAAFNKVIAYGVRQYATEANHRLGEIYLTLANDLMDSERPEGLSALEATQYEILLEEQAFPFEEKAIAVYELNANRIPGGIYDEWVQASMESLAALLPVRYRKQEITEVLHENDL